MHLMKRYVSQLLNDSIISYFSFFRDLESCGDNLMVKQQTIKPAHDLMERAN